MVTRHAPRHEQIAIRVWNPAMTTWWAVTDYDDLSLEAVSYTHLRAHET